MIRLKSLVLLTMTVSFVTIIGLIALSFFTHHAEQELMEHKRLRKTTGTIVDKVHVHFATDQTSYQNDEGRTVPVEGWRRASGELRIYYTIDNFDQIPNSSRSAIVTAERERTKKYGSRFRLVDQSTFETAIVGQRVIVTYRWISNSAIEVVSIEQ